MCNSDRCHVLPDFFRRAFPGLELAGGAPNLAPRDTMRITETAPLIRLGGSGAPELVQMRWSWSGPGGKLVYNFRSDERRFASSGCLTPADACSSAGRLWAGWWTAGLTARREGASDHAPAWVELD